MPLRSPSDSRWVQQLTWHTRELSAQIENALFNYGYFIALYSLFQQRFYTISFPILPCWNFRVFSIDGWRAPSRGPKVSPNWTGPAASGKWFCPGFEVLTKRGKIPFLYDPRWNVTVNCVSCGSNKSKKYIAMFEWFTVHSSLDVHVMCCWVTITCVTGYCELIILFTKASCH